jgi:hypothetical protein
MNQETKEFIEYIEESGFTRDIDDNLWYTSDYKKRISPNYYNIHAYHIYYPGGSFSNPIRINNLDELKIHLGDIEFITP